MFPMPRTLIIRLIWILMLMPSGFPAFAAEAGVDELLKIKQDRVEVYALPEEDSNHVLLAMDFNSSVIINPLLAGKYRGRLIEKVDLVYTSYRLSDEFSQPKLNEKRLRNLEKLSPELFGTKDIKWGFYAQVSGKTEAEARKLFHGFVITLLPESSTALTTKEIDYLDKLVNNDSIGKDTFMVIPRVTLKKKKIKTQYYLPRWSFLHKKGKLFTGPGIWNRKRLLVTHIDTIRRYESVNVFNLSGNSWKYLSQLDSTIFSVMRRNSSWDNILFVCDVTGSMSVYTAQTLIWSKMNFNAHRARYFTFFNDGDNMKDSEKRIGQTGGIYHTEAKSVRDIETTAKLAMVKGNGGDTPENYIEAILDALNRFPSASEIVVVADNWAGIKDIELLHKVKKPVHVILCGTEAGINMDYVRLAMKTGGSIHTMHEDIRNFGLLKEGDKLRLGSDMFQFINGRLRRMREL